MRLKSIVAALALGLASAAGAAAPSSGDRALTGLWDAQVTVDGSVIPFQLSLSQTGDQVKSSFFDGDRPVNPSSRGSFKGGDLRLAFDSYATGLTAHLDKGVLTGAYGGARHSYPFEARPHRAEPPAKGAPRIDGLWEIPVDARNEKAWRLVIRQAGPRLYATILRIDGDTGSMSGSWRNGAFHLSHFAGERPEVMLVTPVGDGSLALVLTDDDGSANRALRAVRPAVARKEGSAPPADAANHTTVKDPNEPLHFAAKDLFTGKPVADGDARFKRKVVLVNVMGSWCPNCHDEAPFLAKLYDTYHARGLEIVALDFEYPDQLDDPQRARAFVKRYGVKYTVLLAGRLSDLHTVLPQAVNLHAWPTTFFLGRDGKVKSVHVGFTSAGSGPYDAKLKADVTREVERLLAGKTG